MQSYLWAASSQAFAISLLASPMPSVGRGGSDADGVEEALLLEMASWRFLAREMWVRGKRGRRKKYSSSF